MNIRTKTVFLTVATLILGIALGALINPLSKDSKHRKRTPRDLFGYLEKIIQPEASQKEALKTLFQEYEQRLDRNSRNYRKNSHATMDSLYTDLASILNAEQNKRLQLKREEWRKKRKNPGVTDQKVETRIEEIRSNTARRLNAGWIPVNTSLGSNK